jgi:hypothetical protein
VFGSVLFSLPGLYGFLSESAAGVTVISATGLRLHTGLVACTVRAACSRVSPPGAGKTSRRGLFNMEIHACVTARSRAGAGTRIVIHVVTIIVVVVLLKAGYPVPGAVLAAAGAGWAVRPAGQPDPLTITWGSR